MYKFVKTSVSLDKYLLFTEQMLVRVHELLQEAVFSSVLCSSFQACWSMEALREYFFFFGSVGKSSNTDTL